MFTEDFDAYRRTLAFAMSVMTSSCDSGVVPIGTAMAVRRFPRATALEEFDLLHDEANEVTAELSRTGTIADYVSLFKIHGRTARPRVVPLEAPLHFRTHGTCAVRPTNSWKRAREVTCEALRRPEIWAGVVALADELERTGNMCPDAVDEFLPEPDSTWPPSVVAKRWA